MVYYAVLILSFGTVSLIYNIKSSINKKNILLNKKYVVMDNKYYKLKKIASYISYINIVLWSIFVYFSFINHIGLYCALAASGNLLSTYTLKTISINKNLVSTTQLN